MLAATLTACGGGDDSTAASSEPPANPPPSQTSLQLLRTVPQERANDVDPDAVPALVFSEAIHTNTAQLQVSLTGPEGQVPGKLRITGSEIAFEPQTSLVLQSEYRLDADAISSINGHRFPGAIQLHFKVRGGSWSTAQPLDSEAGAADGAQVAADARGNAIAVWQQAGINRVQLWASRFDARSGQWSAPVTLDADTGAGNASAPRIAMDAQGNATVIWFQEATAGATGVLLWARQYDTSRSAWSAAPLPIGGQPDSFGRRQASVAVGKDGSAIAVWINAGSVWANHYDAATMRWTGERDITLEDSSSGAVSDPQIVIDEQGRAIAAWISLRTAASAFASSRYDPGTKTWQRLNSPDNGPGQLIYGLQLAVNKHGDAVATWGVDRYLVEPRRRELRVSRYDKAGGGWSSFSVAAEALGPGDFANAYLVNHAVTLDGDRHHWVLWSELNNAKIRLRARRYDAQSNSWTDPVTLDDNAGSTDEFGETAISAMAGLDVCSNLLTVWTRIALDTGGRTQIGLISRRHDALNSAWGPPIVLGSTSAAPQTPLTVPHLAIAASGRAWSAWTQQDASGERNVWANRYR